MEMRADLLIVGAGMVGSALALALQNSGLEVLLLDGSPTELMTDSNLEAIYGLPMQVLSHPRGQQPIAVVV